MHLVLCIALWILMVCSGILLILLYWMQGFLSAFKGRKRILAAATVIVVFIILAGIAVYPLFW
ncbi:MAG: hypothetical protein ACTSXJ_10920 [Candidatus Baldrarchaeia archaeon]